ncbi:MAG: response regulator transcription factor [Flavobacteriales bacterium]|nr:response regulator transcription factor [Flavobacteriales bacterium]
MKHHVALVDDHHLLRGGLGSVVNRLGGYQVTLEAGHGKEFIELLRDAEPPAIAIVDLNMPVMDGYATLHWLRANRPEIRPLVLTFDADDDAMARAVRAGARGFLLKDVSPAMLKAALDGIMRDGYHLPEEALLAADGHGGRRHGDLMARISKRELEFLLHICSDEEPTYEQVAKAMGVSRSTVDKFREHLFEKLGVKSKTGLVMLAMRMGLVR